MQGHEVAEGVSEAVQTAGHSTAHAAEHAAHELPNFITLLNHFFDSSWTHFLHRWENVLFSLLAAALIVATALTAASKKNLIPKGIQNFWEALAEGIASFVTGILGPEHAKDHIPYLGTVFVYILLMNWSGLIPLFKSPTSSWGTTIAVALATMVYVQWTGIRTQGPLHYLKHIAGNPQNLFGIILIPLMLVINLTVEFVAVPLSLSLRLFANVSSEDRLLFNFAHLSVNLTPLLALFQLFANVLAIAFSVVQAFVFMLLSTVYISLVLPHEQHGHEEHGHGEKKSHAAAAHAH